MIIGCVSCKTVNIIKDIVKDPDLLQCCKIVIQFYPYTSFLIRLDLVFNFFFTQIGKLIACYDKTALQKVDSPIRCPIL
jgi:hypothetical protein